LIRHYQPGGGLPTGWVDDLDTADKSHEAEQLVWSTFIYSSTSRRRYSSEDKWSSQVFLHPVSGDTSRAINMQDSLVGSLSYRIADPTFTSFINLAKRLTIHDYLRHPLEPLWWKFELPNTYREILKIQCTFLN
jgi:hypothetical protein